MSSRQEEKRPEHHGSEMEGATPFKPKAYTRGRGPHWDRIYNDAEALIANAVPETDPFLYNLLQRHFPSIESLPGLNDRETLVKLITLFVDHLDGSITVREALIYLAWSDWDLEPAVSSYLDEELESSEEEASEAALELGSELEDVEKPLIEGQDDSEVTMSATYISHLARANTGVLLSQDSKAEEDVPTAEKEAINKHLDRKPAVKGTRDDNKFEIRIKLLKGGEKVSRFQAHNHGVDFDWDNSAHIRDLNRWRSQRFLRHVGAVRSPFIPENSSHEQLY